MLAHSTICFVQKLRVECLETLGGKHAHSLHALRWGVDLAVAKIVEKAAKAIRAQLTPRRSKSLTKAGEDDLGSLYGMT